MRRGAFIGIALLALSHFAFANVTAALAQAGSTGGTVGKMDKSISGGVDTNTPGAAVHPKRAATKSQEKSSGRSSCSKIAGSWTWFLGVSVTVLNQDGTARNTGNTGRWTCTTINWITGAIDRITISQDGNSLVVLSQLNGGTTFTATRRSGD